MNKITVNIASSHRFHLLNIACELDRQGLDVRFYSYVPTKRCAKFGIDPTICHSLLWLVWPFLILCKVLPPKKSHRIVKLRNQLMDWYLSKTMRKCDIFIGLGSVYLYSFKMAKKKWNAITILEWGSKHVIEQYYQFGMLPKRPEIIYRRELESYQICDYISIPSMHVADSFIKHSIPNFKLIINPYGVDLSHFYPTRYEGRYDLIYVGGWRYEKGCDLIIELCKKYCYHFLHVGSIVNMEFPKSDYMHHVDSVDQTNLIDYYKQSKVFILPSRSEGLALVQAQAIACGLPIVCSTETGGRDLRELITNQKYVVEMHSFDVESLHECVENALSITQDQTGLRDYSAQDMFNLSWEAYGKRYRDNLFSVLYR